MNLPIVGLGFVVFIMYSIIVLRIGYMSGCKDWKQTKKWMEHELGGKRK